MNQNTDNTYFDSSQINAVNEIIKLGKEADLKNLNKTILPFQSTAPAPFLDCFSNWICGSGKLFE